MTLFRSRRRRNYIPAQPTVRVLVEVNQNTAMSIPMSQRKIENYIKLTGTILSESSKALHFQFEDANGDERTRWFPLSQMKSIARTNDIGTDSIEVAQWILDKDGIPY